MVIQGKEGCPAMLLWELAAQTEHGWSSENHALQWEPQTQPPHGEPTAVAETLADSLQAASQRADRQSRAL